MTPQHLLKLQHKFWTYKYIDSSCFELLEMDTDINYFAFSEGSIGKRIKPHMREEFEKNKYFVYLENQMNSTQHFKLME